MAKYLFQVSYTAESVQALLKNGSSARKARSKQLIEGMGGKQEGYYLAFGETDLYIIAELPDRETAAALALYTSSSGSIKVKTTVLLTAEEADKAAQKAANYQPAEA